MFKLNIFMGIIKCISFKRTTKLCTITDVNYDGIFSAKITLSLTVCHEVDVQDNAQATTYE